jgi:hypothetical protein
MPVRYTFFHPMHHWGLKSELTRQNMCSLSGLRRRYTGIELDRYQPRFHLAKPLDPGDDTGEQKEKNVRNPVSLWPIATAAVRVIAIVVEVEAAGEEKQINENELLSDISILSDDERVKKTYKNQIKSKSD